jgi:integrase
MLHPTDGSPALAPKTVYDVHLVIRGALADAVRRGLLTRNVALVANAPKLRSIPKVEQKAWTAPELQAFLRAAAGHRLFPAYWLAAMTGMRRNELLGLRWTDLDTKHSRLSINRGLVAVGYELHETRGKTRNSRRSIDLGPPPSMCSQAGGPCKPPSSPPWASSTPAGCSPDPTADPSTPMPSARASNTSFAEHGCR